MDTTSLHFQISSPLTPSFSDTSEAPGRKASAAAAAAFSSLQALDTSTPPLHGFTFQFSPYPLGDVPQFRGRFTKEFLSHIYSAPSNLPLFYLIFSFISSQFSSLEEGNLELTRNYLKILNPTDPNQRKILLKKTLLAFKNKGTPQSPGLVAKDLTLRLIDELSEILGETPSILASEFFAPTEISSEERSLYYLIERSFTIYQIYKFILLTLKDNNKFKEVHEISTELIKSLLPKIQNLENPTKDPYDSVIRDFIEELKNTYTNIIEENATHILLNAGRITDLFIIKVQFLEKSLTLSTAFERLLPYEDYLLGHTDTALRYLKPMVDSLKERIELMLKLIVFRFVIRDVRCITKAEVIRAIQAYIQPTQFRELIKNFTSSEHKLYTHYLYLNTYLKQVEDLIALFPSSATEYVHHSKIVTPYFEDLRKPPPPPKKKLLIAPKSQQKVASEPSTRPLSAKTPLLSETKKPLLLISVIEAPTDLLISTPNLSSLTSYARDALQIAFKYAESLFHLKTAIRQTRDPIKISHLYLDVLIASHYCLEQAATSCLRIPDKDAFDAIVAAAGHSLLHRFSAAEFPRTDEAVASVEGVEYFIRGLPFSSGAHPTLVPWTLLRQAIDPAKVQSLREETLQRLSQTLRVFFEAIKTIPAIESIFDEAKFEIFLSEPPAPLEEIIDSAEDPLPEQLSVALAKLQTIKAVLIAKQSAATTSIVQTLCFKIERLHHALSHFRNPHLVDFMGAQFRLLEMEMLEIALSQGQHLGREEAHNLMALATDLDLSNLIGTESSFLRSAKGLRVIARYSEMSSPIIKKEAIFVERPLIEPSKAGAHSTEKFTVVKSAMQISAESKLSDQLPLVCSILEKALAKRALVSGKLHEELI